MKTPNFNCLKVKIRHEDASEQIKDFPVWWIQNGTVVSRIPNAKTGIATFYDICPGDTEIAVGRDLRTPLHSRVTSISDKGTQTIIISIGRGELLADSKTNLFVDIRQSKEDRIAIAAKDKPYGSWSVISAESLTAAVRATRSLESNAFDNLVFASHGNNDGQKAWISVREKARTNEDQLSTAEINAFIDGKTTTPTTSAHALSMLKLGSKVKPVCRVDLST